jgi:hypothetical protein
MRIVIFIFGLFSLFLTGCQVVSGSGNVVTEERQMSEFDGVSLSGIGEVLFIQADEQSVLIEAEDNILPYITTEVHRDVLYIGIKDGVSIKNNAPLKFTVTTPEITLFDVSGSGTINAETIDADELMVDVSGSGEIGIENMETESLSIQISGSGDVMAQGEATDQVINITGSGSYAAPDLLSDDIDIHVSGSGEAMVWAMDTLSVNISGAGKVAYQGKPQVKHSITGAGVVQKVAGR